MRNLLILLMAITSLSLMGQETVMNNSEITEFKHLVNSTASEIKTIQSDFTQYKHMDFLSNDIETSGKMAFKEPNLIKWEYTKPYTYSVIFNTGKIYIDDDGSKSNMDLGNNRLFKKLNELIIGSVKGDMLNETDFDMVYFNTVKGNKVIFKPKAKNILSYITSVELLFNNKEGTVDEVKMLEPSGDYTQIVFQNRTINQPLPDAVFNH
jgi:outer membrane lipoprotein-sorting protein